MKKVLVAAILGWLASDLVGQSAPFGSQQVITTAADGANGVFASDLDGDGDQDVLSASGIDDKISWYENLGGGTFGSQQVITTAANGARSVFAADLDGDGDQDVLSASFNDDKVAWYANLGGGVFGSQQVITTAANGPECVFAADLDGDGDQDVLSASSVDDKIAWYENLGGGAFGPQQVITTNADRAFSVFAVDLDGDGDQDVLSASSVDDKVAWYENLGGGSFGPQQVISTAANGAWAVYAADMDGDGDQDVLSASRYDAKIAWYENLGGGAFGSQQVITTAASGAISVFAADLDGDGDQDVLSASIDDHKISWYENLGGGAFGSQQVITTAANGARSVFAADLDGDGDQDVLSASITDDKVAWYENQFIPPGSLSDVSSNLFTTTSTPFAMRGHAVAPLPSGGALLSGGETANGTFVLTFELGGTDWNKQFSTLNPMARTGQSLILDEANQNNVLFGGVNPAGTKLSDTWTYVNGQWSYLTPTSAPAPRSEHAMAFDPAAGVGVLFAGEGASGTALADMWSWDGTNWSQLTPATVPPARFGHGLAYDRFRGRLVLFGGTAGSSRLDDVWEWDGTDWTQITPAQPTGYPWGPSARDGFAMAYDPRAERVVVIGGETDVGCVDDVWSWDGTVWTRHDPAAGVALPSARRDAAIYVDTFSGAVRLFGGGCGSEFSDELWEFQLPVFARSEVIGVGCAGSNGVPILEIANGTAPVLGTQLDFAYRNGPTSPLFTPIISTGFDNQLFNGIPLPLPLGVIGLPGCVLYHSAELTAAASSTPVVGEFTWSVSLPTDPIYLGQEFFFQGLHLDLGLLPTSVAAMSNAVGIRIGDQ